MYAVTMTSIEYLKERKRETDTDTHTQIDRQTDRQTGREIVIVSLREIITHF